MASDLTKIVQDWGAENVKQAQDFLTSSGKSNTGTLRDSLRFETTQKDGNYTGLFFSAEYGEFVRLGVQGKGPFTGAQPNKAPKSPFKFGSGKGKGKIVPAIDRWVITRGIPGIRDSKGRFIPRKSLVFLIARKIFRFGIKPTNYIFPFFKNQDQLVQGVGQERANFIRDELRKAFNETALLYLTLRPCFI